MHHASRYAAGSVHRGARSRPGGDMTYSARVGVVHRQALFCQVCAVCPMNVILTLMLRVLRGMPQCLTQYVQQDDREHTPDSGGRLAGRGCCT